MIERNFDTSFVANLALREKQIQQNYRPIIAVHKWFARRPGTVFRALVLSEFGNGPLRDSFYRANRFKGIRIADPFMGGGTPLLEANRTGCDVIGYDINPMAYWIVKQEIAHLDLTEYREAALKVRQDLDQTVGGLYRTKCLVCDSKQASAKYFLWVKQHICANCGRELDLFPSYLVAENRRHPKNVLVCSACGELSEVSDLDKPGNCRSCGVALVVKGPARSGRCICPRCEYRNQFPDPKSGPPKHRMFAIEYSCPACRASHLGRFFKKPDNDDLSRFERAARALRKTEPDLIPKEAIPNGDETDRLHRWGYRFYRQMFNDRQLLGLGQICRFIMRLPEGPVRSALATNLSDLLRYQNMLCRYDTMALKSLDIFSVHGFPVGLVQCESNLLGITNGETGQAIGSGGWFNITDKFAKAKSYCDAPFEIRHDGTRKVQVPITGEWIGEHRGNGKIVERRQVKLRCENAAESTLPKASLDAVLTDPPYFGNVQYAELMDFCYVWLRRLVAGKDPAFRAESTRRADELTRNLDMGRGIEHFTQGLSEVFRRMAAALKPGSPLAFTYHHNDLEAYLPVAVALLDAGLVCSASLPCPGEMSASIHINGTGSSIIDTILVCRSTGTVSRRTIVDSAAGVAQLVREDLARLKAGSVKPTQGDIRCITYGHLIRLAVWFLRKEWDSGSPTPKRLAAVRAQVTKIGDPAAILHDLQDAATERQTKWPEECRESEVSYGETSDEIPF